MIIENLKKIYIYFRGSKFGSVNLKPQLHEFRGNTTRTSWNWGWAGARFVSPQRAAECARRRCRNFELSRTSRIQTNGHHSRFTIRLAVALNGSSIYFYICKALCSDKLAQWTFPESRDTPETNYPKFLRRKRGKIHTQHPLVSIYPATQPA